MYWIKKRRLWPLVLFFILSVLSAVSCAAGTGGGAEISRAAADSGPGPDSAGAPSLGTGPVPETGAAAAPGARPDSGSRLAVHFIDVGQGDSILLQSGDHAMLIDGGSADQAETLIDYLRGQGVGTFDYVAGTHPDSDHIGGLPAVLRAFGAKTVLLPAKEHTTSAFEALLDTMGDLKLKITLPAAGEVYPLGEASFQIVSPSAGADYGNSNNNWSLGLRLTYHNNRFLFCGDAEAEAEHDMCASGLAMSADVLKLSHHGSSSSSTEEFLDKVSPDAAVISCGEDNPYGHPSREVLNRLAGRNIRIFRTDLQGTVVAVSDGDTVTWNAGPEASPLPSPPAAGEPGSASLEAESSPAAGPGSSDEEAGARTETGYILNKNSHKFHLPDCPSVKDISSRNRQDFQGSREEAIQNGYSPCKSCNP